VITAVGMVDDISIMVASIIIAVIVMLVFAEPVSRFVEKHPTLKMLALSFLILIGVMLIAEGVGAHMDKGYIYFAMFFALIVEVMNIGLRQKQPEAVAEGSGTDL
jgi:predicted tellurium resistance membrane protein TerC